MCAPWSTRIPPPATSAVGAPGGRPVRVALVGLRAVHLVLREVDPAEARQAGGAPPATAASSGTGGRAGTRCRPRARSPRFAPRRRRSGPGASRTGRGGRAPPPARSSGRWVKGGVQMSQKSSCLAVQQLLGVGVGGRAPGRSARAASRLEGERSATATISTSPRRRSSPPTAARGRGARCCRRRGARRAASSPASVTARRVAKTSSRIPRAVSAVARSMDSAGFTRKCGL